MKINHIIFLSLLTVLMACSGNSNAAETPASAEVVAGIPAKNTVTLVDLGADTCVPCRLMAPIIKELKAEYQGRAEVIFIDVYDSANAGKAKAFQIRAIPTQIVYDRLGKEVFRHMGFLDKKAMQEQLDTFLAVK